MCHISLPKCTGPPDSGLREAELRHRIAFGSAEPARSASVARYVRLVVAERATSTVGDPVGNREDLRRGEEGESILFCSETLSDSLRGQRHGGIVSGGGPWRHRGRRCAW